MPKTGPETEASRGHIWALEMEPDALSAAGRDPALPLRTGMLGKGACMCSAAEVAGENLDKNPTASWKPAAFPRARRPGQTLEGSFGQGTQRTQLDVSLLNS